MNNWKSVEKFLCDRLDIIRIVNRKAEKHVHSSISVIARCYQLVKRGQLFIGLCNSFSYVAGVSDGLACMMHLVCSVYYSQVTMFCHILPDLN